jgi:ribosomal-protein-alanine N-acetyltransferase
MNMTKDIFLEGDRIVLRMLNEEDINGNYARWLNDAEITLYNSHGRFPMSIEKLRDFVKSAYASNTALVLAVCDKDSGTHIGNISLQSISWVDRSAEIAFILGEKDFWGKGVMLEAGKIMIRHAFDVLNLHRVHCGTSSENIGMQKLAEKLGMNLEGVRKEALFKNGNYYDILEYGLLSR